MTDSDDAIHPPAPHIGRHGSPNVMIAFPFSNISTNEGPLRDAVVELAGLVARLASAPGTAEHADERATVRAAAEELAARLSVV
jgi:hypothetical protein